MKFTMQSPIKPKDYGTGAGIITLTQLFGDNQMDYSLLGLKGHNGEDYRTKHFDGGNAPVMAAHDGIVISEKDKQSDTAGRFVKIESAEVEIDGRLCKVQTVYFHLKSCRHAKGTPVKRGQLIGTSDNTGGFTTGAHLHFGMYILWKRSDGQYTVDDNGFGGAVDPRPFMIDEQVYQYGDGMFGRQFFYNGKRIKRSEVDALIPKQYR
jgi:murein DD-endopeptidase MepM/ murein hydrolase activator NlpD